MTREDMWYLPADPDDTPTTDTCLWDLDSDHCGLPLADDADLDQVLCPHHQDAEERGDITAHDLDDLLTRYQTTV